MKKCKSCNAGIDVNAKKCPTCGRPQTTRKTKLIATFVVLFIVFTIWGPAGKEYSHSETAQNSTSSAPTAKPAESNPGPVPPAWSYTSSEDEMTSEKTYRATVKSDNIVIFDFPYNKPQRAKLTLRTHPRHGRDVLFSIDHGQLLCSHGGCSVLVRFGSGEPVKFRASRAADGRSTTLFIRDYSRFAGEMLKVDTVRIAPEVYKEGSPVFTFDVHGFDVEKYRPSKQ